ncbi:hypothetical protein GCM10023075_24530 [Streptosporangium album]
MLAFGGERLGRVVGYVGGQLMCGHAEAPPIRSTEVVVITGSESASLPATCVRSKGLIAGRVDVRTFGERLATLRYTVPKQ